MSTYKPTEAMASAAKKALKIRDEQPDSNKGMTQVGLTRARQLISRESLSLDTVKRMHSFFSRHEVDKKGEGWGKDSKGYQAWLGWGGDAGQSWAKAIVEREAKAKNISVNELIADIDEALNADASKSIMDSLRKKAKDHNEDAKHKVTAEKLYKIFKRGVGAYKTNPQSVKLGVSGSTEWGHRRVNAWLIALESGKFKSGAFDTDLLPKDHPAKNSESDVLDYKQVNTGLSDMNQNQIIINTKASGSKIREDENYFYLDQIPTTKLDKVMNRVMYAENDMRESINTMDGKPFTLDHPVDSSGNFIDAMVGDGLTEFFSGGVAQRNYIKDGYSYADVKIKKSLLRAQDGGEKLEQKIVNREDIGVSTGLFFANNAESGRDKYGNEYDKKAKGITFNHLAFVDNPAGGKDTTASFNSSTIVVNLADEEEQVNGIINALKSAPKAVRDFFGSVLHKPITNGYNEQDDNISTNEEVSTAMNQHLIDAINSDADFAEAVNEMMKKKEGEKTPDMMNMTDEDMKNMSEEDKLKMMKKMKNMLGKKENMYKKNSSDNPELEALQAQVNSMASELKAVKGAEKDALVNRLANSDCGLDKEDLAALEVNSLQKLEAKFLGQVNGQFPQGQSQAQNASDDYSFSMPE